VSKFDGGLENVLLSTEYENLRSMSLKGIPIKGCEKCYYEESLGKESLRQKFNSTYTNDTVALEYFEVGFDNICNLTCDGCFDEFSSSWAEKNNPGQSKKFYITSTSEIETIPQTINKVLFLGGEPLMTNRHIRFLQKIINKQTVSVTYNTNGTFLLSTDTIALLKEFKLVEFIVSVDGYKEVNDRVRSGSNWESIENFLNQLTTNSFKFSIHTTIHTNNWFDLPNVSSWIKENSYSWTTNILTYPPRLDIKNLSTVDKNKMIEYLNDADFDNKQYLINHLKELEHE
jgi:sulfatase maturation enzyme AslB (radical SAM superfamily)